MPSHVDTSNADVTAHHCLPVKFFITVMQNRAIYGDAVDSFVASQQEYPGPGILEVLHSVCFPPQFGDIHARLMGDSKSLF